VAYRLTQLNRRNDSENSCGWVYSCIYDYGSMGYLILVQEGHLPSGKCKNVYVCYALSEQATVPMHINHAGNSFSFVLYNMGKVRTTSINLLCIL